MPARSAIAAMLCLAFALTLAACGGGNAIPTTPGAPPTEPEAEAPGAQAPLVRIIAQSPVRLITYAGGDVKSIPKPANLTIDNFVSAAGDEPYDDVLESSLTVPHSTYTNWEDSENSSLPDWDGISMVDGEGCHPCSPSATVNTSVMNAGYLKYSAFFLFEKKFEGPLPSEPNGEPVVAAEIFSYSLGPVTVNGANPEFNATWKGGMIGKIERYFKEAGNLLTGDATITVGMDGSSQDAVSVRFTNIVDSETGAKHNGLSWTDLPLQNGSFHHQNEGVYDSDGNIRGSFYGANHEEVGGVFDSAIFDGDKHLTGAFGAVRQ